MHTAVVKFSPARVLSLSLLQRTDKHNHGRNEQPRLHKQPRILDRLSGALAAPWAVLHAPVFLVFPLAPPALFQAPTSTRNRAVGLEPPIGGQNGHSFTKRARKPRSKASCLSKKNRVSIVKSILKRERGTLTRTNIPVWQIPDRLGEVCVYFPWELGQVRLESLEWDERDER